MVPSPSSSKAGGGEVKAVAPQGPAQRRARRRNITFQLPLLIIVIFVALAGSAQAFIRLRPSPSSSSSSSCPAPRLLTQAHLFGLGGRSDNKNKSSPTGMKAPTPRPFAPENMATYDDDLFAKIWIFLFSGKIAAVVGVPSPRRFIEYEEYVRLSQLLLKAGSTKAKTAVLTVLRSIAFPGFSSIFRTLFPGTSRFACEFNAKVTPVFFSWLVGPAVVETSEMRNPKTDEVEVWANSVKIQRCRYLESVQCKGACASICKLPTQAFFTEDLGMPVTMTPNFDDLSCTMTFGVAPLASSADPICSEGCFKECSSAIISKKACPKIMAALNGGE